MADVGSGPEVGIFIAYSIALFIGVALIFSRQPGLPLTFTAERELPANWLLQPGDLALRPGDHPWYLKHTAKKDQKIGLGDLSTFPIIAQRQGKLPVAFSVGSAMVKSSAINAGVSAELRLFSVLPAISAHQGRPSYQRHAPSIQRTGGRNVAIR